MAINALDKARALLRALSDTDTPKTENPYTAAKSAMTGYTGSAGVSYATLTKMADEIDNGILEDLASIEEEDPFEAAAQLLGITRDDLEKIFENSVKWTEAEQHTRNLDVVGVDTTVPLMFTSGSGTVSYGTTDYPFTAGDVLHVRYK